MWQWLSHSNISSFFLFFFFVRRWRWKQVTLNNICWGDCVYNLFLVCTLMSLSHAARAKATDAVRSCGDLRGTFAAILRLTDPTRWSAHHRQPPINLYLLVAEAKSAVGLSPSGFHSPGAGEGQKKLRRRKLTARTMTVVCFDPRRLAVQTLGFRIWMDGFHHM